MGGQSVHVHPIAGACCRPTHRKWKLLSQRAQERRRPASSAHFEHTEPGLGRRRMAKPAERGVGGGLLSKAELGKRRLLI